MTYDPFNTPKPRRWRRWLIGIALITLLVFIISLESFHSDSYCSLCGRERDIAGYRIPFTSISLWSTTSEKSTPLSAIVDAAGLVPAHPHHWVFSSEQQQGLFYTSEVLGDEFLYAAVRDHQMIPFFNDIARYDGSAAAAKWLPILLDESLAKAASHALTYADYPSDGFPTAADYKSWWASHGAEIDAALPTTRPAQ